MSKLYSLYESLKKEDSKTIYLFKSGIFFIALEDDAKCLSEKFDFRLTQLGTNTVKCGFPASKIDKYTKIFNNNNITFKLVDTSNNTSYSFNEYEINDNVKNILNSISNVDIEHLSVSEAFKFIENLKKATADIKTDVK